MSYDNWSSDDSRRSDPISRLRKIVTDPSTSITMLRQLISRNPEMELHVIDNPSASDTLLREIVDREKGSRLRVKTSKIARLPTASIRLLNHIYDLESVMPSEVYTSLAQNPNLPENIMLKMIEHGRSACYDILLENPKISPVVLDRLLELNLRSLTLDTLEHPNISQETLQRMSNSRDDGIVELIASNPHTSVELIEQLVSRDVKWHNAIIENPNVPVSILEQLDYDSIYPGSIRKMLKAKTPPKSVIKKIIQSTQYNVFLTVYKSRYAEIDDLLAGIDRFKKFNSEEVFAYIYKNRKQDMKTFFAKEYNLDISSLSYDMTKDLLGIENGTV
jgi:hypothetical protein